MEPADSLGTKRRDDDDVRTNGTVHLLLLDCDVSASNSLGFKKYHLKTPTCVWELQLKVGCVALVRRKCCLIDVVDDKGRQDAQ